MATRGTEWGIGYGNNVVPVYTYNSRLQPSEFYTTIGNSGNAYLLTLRTAPRLPQRVVGLTSAS